MITFSVRSPPFSYAGTFPAHTILTGPSGSGKTTLLETIAGLRPHTGSVEVAGRPLSVEPPERRGIGYAFQDDRLFPHLTVGQNIRFSGGDAGAVVEALELSPLLDRRPRLLSGGEKKRVNIARAFIAAKQLLLLDEPLGPLDDRLQQRVLDLVRRSQLPFVLVTHLAVGFGSLVPISDVVRST